MGNAERCYRITFGSVCALAVTRASDTRVMPDSAPVLRWAYGKPFSVLAQWVLAKGGSVEELPSRSWP